jgi:hypothetical protein
MSTWGNFQPQIPEQTGSELGPTDYGAGSISMAVHNFR